MVDNNDDIKIERSDLLNFIRECVELKVPYFQREYTWDKKQIKQLIKDVSESKTTNYYIGTIVISHKNGVWYIIDGQQRISTLILILNELLYNHYFIDENNFKNIDHFKSFLGKFSFASANIIDGNNLDEIIHKNDGYNKKNNKYFDNVKVIDEEIKSLNKNNLINKFLENFNNIIFSLVIFYSSKIDENILFEKINSTGIPLSQYDLSKNYLLSKIWNNYENGDKNKFIKKYTNELHELTKFLDSNNNLNEKNNANSKNKKAINKDDLIRSFIAYKTSWLPNKNEVYEEFKKLVEINFDYNGLKVFDEFKKFVLYYQYIFERKWKDEIFENQMLLIEQQFNTFIVLVISILEINSVIEDEEILINNEQKQEIHKLLLVIECYIYRRTYVKLSEKIISRKIPEIKFNINDNKNLEEQLFYKLYSKEDNINRAYRMPSYQEFYENIYIQNRNLYTSNKKITQLFLYRLGTFDIKEKIQNDRLTIEHIIPQKYQKIEEYNKDEKIEQKMHVLGNLTLTAYNSEYSNEPFFIKKDKMLSKDNFPLNKYFLNLKEWNTNEIDKRTKYLLDKTKQIWNYDHYEISNDKNINDIQENTKNNPIQINNTKEIKIKYNDLKNFITALKNIVHFKKINKQLITYDNIKQIIQAYVLDNITYTDIEETFFHNNFKGWLGQSIIEILDIKDDKEMVSTRDINAYIHSKEDNINQLIEFINDLY